LELIDNIMTLKINLIFALLFTVAGLYGQECTHKDLSYNYDYKTILKRIEIPNSSDSCIITVLIINKVTHKSIHEIKIFSKWLFDDCFTNCSLVRSFITNKNVNATVVDNDYGDLIIVDLNFDGKEDIAIKNNSGGNGGPEYNFYINKNNLFYLDNFLTQKVKHFPTIIDKQTNTIITNVHANAFQYCRTYFNYDTNSNSWHIINSELIDANK
jgi:hypothetical protein